MSQAVYIHIPYCKQLCHYCNFAKYKVGKTISPSDYINLLNLEIKHMSHFIKNPNSIYLGGGTPSMIGARNIKLILDMVGTCDDITVEVDPGTANADDIDVLIEAGVNRISLGVQSMNDALLRKIGRTHTEKDNLSLVEILNKRKLNFSMDLLFALPNQRLSDLQTDIDKFLACDPKHISTYLLEIPKRHTLGQNRAKEIEQVEMIKAINYSLGRANFIRYELSNYAKAGFQSRHNLAYWNDLPYVGLGLSAHSYIKEMGRWGARLWNARNMKQYASQVSTTYMCRNAEVLTMANSLTDFCHTQLRKLEGLSCDALKSKYGAGAYEVFLNRANLISDEGYIIMGRKILLSEKGKLFLNVILEKLLFSDEDLADIS